MPEDNPQGATTSDPSPELLALLEDLKAYDNPEAYADPNEPHVYKLRIVSTALEQMPTVLRLEVNGISLMTVLREVLFRSISGIPNLDQMMKDMGAKDLVELRTKIAEDPLYPRIESDVYWFFVRHLPKLMLKLYEIVLAMSVMSIGTSNLLDAKERKEVEPALKQLLEFGLKDLRREIKRMLRTRPRGGKTPTLAPDLRESLHLAYDHFHGIAKTIKKHHDSLFQTFNAQHHRVSPQDWQAFWIEHAAKVFSEHPKGFLELFAEIDQPSASEAAYLWLARSTGLKQSYVTNLVKDLRKKARQQIATQKQDNESK